MKSLAKWQSLRIFLFERQGKVKIVIQKGFKLIYNYQKIAKIIKATSTLKHTTSKMRSFTSNAQVIVPIILHHHYPHISDPSQHQIAINKSLSIAQPLIVPIQQAGLNFIPLEDFLVLLDEKLLQKQAYIEEIMQFKDTFCGEFDRLCDGVSDKKLLILIRNQRQRIIDCVFDSLKFEKQQMIAKFYDNMMSGYDNEAMKGFEKIVCNTFWKPLLRPLPTGLTEQIKIAFEEIKNEKYEKKIEEITSRIVLFVLNHFKNNQIKLSEFKNANDLKNILKGMSDARKTCSIDIDDADEDKLKLIEEFKSMCIKSITVSLELNNFEMDKFDFVFHHISCMTPIDVGIINAALKKLPRVLKSFNQCFKNATNAELEIVTINLKNLNSLRILALDLSGINNNNAIGDAGVLSIAHLVNQNKQLETFNLNLQRSNNTITDTGLTHLSLGMSELLELAHLELIIGGGNTKLLDDGVNTLSKSLRIMNKMKHLHLDFCLASIPTDAIDYLATSINKMDQMECLNFNFSCGKNAANNNSITLFAQAIGKMPNLYHLEFDFSWGDNEITDDGIVQLSQVIKKSVSIQQLILYIEWGKNGVTDKGIEELSKSIAHLSNIQQLKLNFSNGNHEISDKGMQALAAALKNTNNISDLYFCFSDGNNSITDASMDSLGDALKRMALELSISLDFQCWNNPRVTAKGESIIKNARTFSKIKFYYGSSW